MVSEDVWKRGTTVVQVSVSRFPRIQQLGTHSFSSLSMVRRWPGCCHPVGVLIKMMKVGSQEHMKSGHSPLAHAESIRTSDVHVLNVFVF